MTPSSTLRTTSGFFSFAIFLLCFFSYQAIQAQAPTLASFSPASGPVGSSVVLTGTNFSAIAASNIVYFGAVKGTVTAATATSLTVTVPAGASYKPITVAVAGKVALAISAMPFITTFSGGGAITSGSFTSTGVILLYSSFATKGIAAGDIDGDGKVDLLSANNATTNFSLFRNTSTPGTLSFATADNKTWPGNPNKIHLADLNADGKLEIMGVSSTLSNFTFWQNNSTSGTISITVRQNLPVSGTNLNSLATADFDNDGKIDAVVLGNTSSTLNVIKNNTVSTAVVGLQTGVGDVYTTGTNSIDVSTADFNLDGKQDIVVTGWGAPTSVAIYPNTSTVGNISFGTRISLTVTGATNPSIIAVGDIDGDGKMDLAINDRVGGAVISVFRNTSAVGGTISFAARQAVSGVSGQGQCVDLGDLDGDGKIDLVLGTNSGIDVLKNTSTIGTISFGTGVKFASTLGFEEVAIGDFDGDGRNEYAGISNSAVGAIYVFRNIMAPPTITSFTPARSLTGRTITITGQDFLGSTSVSLGGTAVASFTVVNSTTITAVVGTGASGDVSVTNAFGTGTAAGFIYSLPPTVTGFSPATGPVGTTVTITGTDFGGTPAENIVFFGATKAIVTAASLTSLTVTVPVGATYERLSVLVTPLNLAAYSAKPFLLTYTGSTTNFTALSFASKTDFAAGTNMYQTVLMDMDNDGKADMLASSNGNFFSTHRNTSTIGSVNFAAYTTYATVASGQPFGIAAGDLNADGKPDVVVANTSTGQLSVATNTTAAPGSITYGTRLDFLISAGASPRMVNIVDLDNDGKPEMIATNAGINSFSVFRNTTPVTGAISFAPLVSFSTGSTPVAITAADFDGDGKVDIAIACSGSGTLNLFRNISVAGTISFATPVVISASGANYISTGDLNADGRPDLLVSNGAQISVIQNASSPGSISFFAIGTLTKAATATAISDLNGDGKPDISAAGDSFMAAYANESLPSDDITFSASQNFAALASAFSVTTGDIDGDGKNDVVVTNRALTGSISVFRNTNSAPMPPSITSFTPKTARGGTEIIITGTNLAGAATSVTFGGLIASSFTSGNPNTISAFVQSIGFSGDVVVTNVLGSSTLPGFTYITNTLDVQSCGGSPVFLTSNVTGINYQWQVDTGAGFTNISAANPDYAGVNTVTLTITNAPSTWYGYKYRCIIGATPSNVFTLKFVAHWIGYYTGTSDIEWENTANWNCGKIPDANTDVYVVAGDITVNSAAECRSITAKPGSTVTVTKGSSLDVTK